MSIFNLTPGDNSVPAVDRLVPEVLRQHSVVLADDTPGFIEIGRDVKSASVKLKAGSDPTYVWVSYYDGEADNLDDETRTVATLAAATSDDRVFDLEAGDSFDIIQEKEFNRIHAEIVSGTGAATLKAWPGRGKDNPETPED